MNSLVRSRRERLTWFDCNVNKIPGMVTVFERFFNMNTLKVVFVTCMVMPKLRGITAVYATG